MMRKRQANDRLLSEEKFHDNWAENADLDKVDVIKMNEATTAPEMRYITKELGDINGKKLLDLGCGLGEASVYFAIKGADVTSVDISNKMLEAAKRLAELNNVNIATCKSIAEDLLMKDGQKFDTVYAGNLFHHVEIEPTIRKIIPILKPDGVLVSCDPLAYNPIINIYRIIAKHVRTSDEHPLKLKDINIFKKYFGNVSIRYFWLTSLIIFIIMAIFQFKNPNKERYWKKVVEESDKWAFLYKPLEKFDDFILKIFPFLKPLCWNVVIVAKKPKS